MSSLCNYGNQKKPVTFKTFQVKLSPSVEKKNDTEMFETGNLGLLCYTQMRKHLKLATQKL